VTGTICLGALGSRTYVSMTRRGLHDPEPSRAEVIVRAHAECSEVFEAWLRRFEPVPAGSYGVGTILQFVCANGMHFTTEYLGFGGKPEGVAAELADVVLTCAYYTYRFVSRSIWDDWSPDCGSLKGSIVEAIGIIHTAITMHDARDAISWCFTIAAALQIDLHAAIERKAAYNDVRPPTTRRL
jgi:NTP pyrophosphatase (non-canonical NTP hydrolase)